MGSVDDVPSPWERLSPQHGSCNLKDGELYLNRVKPEETLVEAHSNSNVLIDCQIWV